MEGGFLHLLTILFPWGCTQVTCVLSPAGPNLSSPGLLPSMAQHSPYHLSTDSFIDLDFPLIWGRASPGVGGGAGTLSIVSLLNGWLFLLEIPQHLPAIVPSEAGLLESLNQLTRFRVCGGAFLPPLLQFAASLSLCLLPELRAPSCWPSPSLRISVIWLRALRF